MIILILLAVLFSLVLLSILMIKETIERRHMPFYFYSGIFVLGAMIYVGHMVLIAVIDII